MSKKERIEQLKQEYAKLLGKSVDKLTDDELAMIENGAKVPGWRPAPMGPGGFNPNIARLETAVQENE